MPFNHLINWLSGCRLRPQEMDFFQVLSAVLLFPYVKKLENLRCRTVCGLLLGQPVTICLL
jgi:predicted SprT family Zn-dependent metalloprotease